LRFPPFLAAGRQIEHLAPIIHIVIGFAASLQPEMAWPFLQGRENYAVITFIPEIFPYQYFPGFR